MKRRGAAHCLVEWRHHASSQECRTQWGWPDELASNPCRTLDCGFWSVHDDL